MPGVIHDGRVVLGTGRDSIYELLKYLPEGLMLDVGAAAGWFTHVMRCNSPLSKVIAFEPFPGNHRHFNERNGGDPNVRLLPIAASDKSGAAWFHVAEVISGTAFGSIDLDGYSSLGCISNAKIDDNTIAVETGRIDEIVQDRVRFMKVDVQGAEADVLAGTSKLTEGAGIDIIYIEFSGERDVAEWLDQNGYVLFDGPFVIMPKPECDLGAWSVEKPFELSTGRQVLEAWPKAPPRCLSGYCNFLEEQKKLNGSLWTDLTCVHPRILAEFLIAAGQHKLTQRGDEQTTGDQPII